MADGFDVVPHIGCQLGRTMWNYSYKNSSVSFTANIYLSSDGTVCFQSKGNTTSWHGHWEWGADDRTMTIRFSHDPEAKKLKSTVVFLIDADSSLFVGRDECQRLITMRLLDKYLECDVHECWHTAT